MRFVYSIVKARALPEGTISEWSGGIRAQKKHGKWVKLYEPRSRTLTKDEITQSKWMSATTEMGEVGQAITQAVSETFGVRSYEDLLALRETKGASAMSDVFRSAKDAVDATGVPKTLKQQAIQAIASVLLRVRDRKQDEPQHRLTVKTVSKKGKPVYSYLRHVPEYKPTIANLMRATVMTGGWADMTRLPTGEELKRMEEVGTARVQFGSYRAKRPLVVEQAGDSILIPTVGGIVAHLRQLNKKKQRTRRTYRVRVIIPYEFAMEFLRSHIQSVRTGNSLRMRLARSEGYKRRLAA